MDEKRILLLSQNRLSRMANGKEAYIGEFTMILRHTESLLVGGDGAVSYATRYKQIPTGYMGRLQSQGLALSKDP